MKRNLTLLALLCLVTVIHVNAQVGIGTTTPNASAALEIVSTGKGVLIPRITSAQRTAIATPAEGLMIYQTNTPVGLWMFISGAWIKLSTTNDLFGASSGYAGNTTGATIPVVLGGVDVALPSQQNLGTGISVNGANTIFTVANAGRYRIAYSVNITAALLVSSRIMINGSPNTSLTIAPLVGTTSHRAEAIVTLTAGDAITLQLFGFLGAAQLLAGSQGAGLTIQRVE